MGGSILSCGRRRRATIWGWGKCKKRWKTRRRTFSDPTSRGTGNTRGGTEGSVKETAGGLFVTETKQDHDAKRKLEGEADGMKMKMSIRSREDEMLRSKEIVVSGGGYSRVFSIPTCASCLAVIVSLDPFQRYYCHHVYSLLALSAHETQPCSTPPA
jgi:hypothetical protein